MEIGFDKLDRAFNPRCLAIIGDNDRNGFRWLKSNTSFSGKLYSVQIDPVVAARIVALGFKNYASIFDIPEPVDLAIIAVPRAAATKVLEDCIAKGVAVVVFFTSGFSETGTEEGKSIERIIVEKARASGIAVIGPNCMGIFNPSIGLKHDIRQYHGSAGPISLISQSGTHATSFSIEGHLQGLDVNKSVSFGNGTVIDSTNFLEYFGQDAGTRFIGIYLEGVRDGLSFLKTLKAVAGRKPVVIWKGGQAEGGARATSSHTGSLAVPHSVWLAAVRQCGAVAVDSLEELIDTLKALALLPVVRGPRVALVGSSGGGSVAVADAFDRAGLIVPEFTHQSQDQFASFFSLVGGGCRNPVDLGSNRSHMAQILDIAARDSNIDDVVVVSWWQFWREDIYPGFRRCLIDAAVCTRKGTSKPVLAVLPGSSQPEDVEQLRAVAAELLEAGIPIYSTFERGARALKNVLDYYQRHGVAITSDSRNRSSE